MLFPMYPEGAQLLRFGSVSVIFLALTQIITGVLQGAGLLRGPIIGALIGVSLKIPINWILLGIPQVNIVGAVIGTIVCYLAASAFDVWFLASKMGIAIEFKKILLKPIAAALAMGACCLVIYNLSRKVFGNAVSLTASIAVGVVVYFAFMLLQNGLERDDLLRLPFGRKIADKLGRFIKK
jgi:stage V sporulation protein B